MPMKVETRSRNWFLEQEPYFQKLRMKHEETSDDEGPDVESEEVEKEDELTK